MVHQLKLTFPQLFTLQRGVLARGGRQVLSLRTRERKLWPATQPNDSTGAELLPIAAAAATQLRHNTRLSHSS